MLYFFKQLVQILEDSSIIEKSQKEHIFVISYTMFTKDKMLSIALGIYKIRNLWVKPNTSNFDKLNYAIEYYSCIYNIF